MDRSASVCARERAKAVKRGIGDKNERKGGGVGAGDEVRVWVGVGVGMRVGVAWGVGMGEEVGGGRPRRETSLSKTPKECAKYFALLLCCSL